MTELEKYKAGLERELAAVEKEIGVKQRKKLLLEGKLARAADEFEGECKRNSKRARRAKGEEFPRRAPPSRKTEPAPEPKTEQAPAPAKPKSWL